MEGGEIVLMKEGRPASSSLKGILGSLGRRVFLITRSRAGGYKHIPMEHRITRLLTSIYMGWGTGREQERGCDAGMYEKDD